MVESHCLNNEIESGCVEYTGPDILFLGIKTGDSLSQVIQKLSAVQTPVLPGPTNITTDNIMSKSMVRSPGSLCASKIVKLDFAYSLATTSAGSIFEYDFLPIIRAFPSGYELAATRVTVSGQPSQGISLITDSRSVAMSLSIPVNRYPAVVDVLLRLTAPCGQIDLTTKIDLINPSNTGSFRGLLDANDLNPTAGEVQLTDQLDNLEAKVLNLERTVQEAKGASTGLVQQNQSIQEIQTKVDAPGNLEIPYTKNGGQSSAELTTVVNDLYEEVKLLQDKIATQKVEISNLKSQINAI